MIKYRILVWIIPTILIAGLALAVWHGTARSSDQPGRDTSAGSASRRTQIGEPAASDPPRGGRETPPPPRPPITASAGPSAEPSQLTGDRPPRMPEGAEIAAQIDGKFAQEPVDPGWSSGAERQLRQALESKPSPGTTLASVSCRRSLCRVESLHTSLEAFHNYIDSSYMAEGRLPWNGAVTAMVIEQSETRVKAVSFIAKEGSEIPATQPVEE